MKYKVLIIDSNGFSVLRDGRVLQTFASDLFHARKWADGVSQAGDVAVFYEMQYVKLEEKRY